MKPVPLLFCADMIRSLLNGSKTQTRRLSDRYKNVAGRPFYVRETWHGNHDDSIVIYRADYPEGQDPFKEDQCGEDCFLVGEKWRPSIFMPRWASRITGTIITVERERLQDITEEGAKAEGVAYPTEGPASCYRMGFKTLWNKLHAKDGKDWDSNPVVYVLKLEVKK